MGAAPRLMKSLALFVLVVGWCTACSTMGTSIGTATITTAADPPPRAEAAKPSMRYLSGVDTDYSMRLDRLAGRDQIPADTVMKNALIAGDAKMHITAAVFYDGDQYAVDLIIKNRSSQDVVLRREDIRLVDALGNWFVPVDDWAEASAYGLRGRTVASRSTFAYDDLAQRSTNQMDMQLAGSSSGSKKAPVYDGFDTTMPSSASAQDFSWAKTAPAELPDPLPVPGGESRSYWTYCRAASTVVFPITGFVTVNERHMIFVFER